MARLTPAVVRTLDILELFLDGDAPLSAPDVVRLTGLPRTSVHELLATLVARDYLQKDESGAYRLGVRLLQLGNAYSSRFDMLTAANEAARELSARLGETVSVAVLEGADVFYLAKVEARDNLRLPSSIGHRLPANATGLGKAMLAYVSPPRLRELFPDASQLPVMTASSIRTLPELEEALAGVRESGVAFEREESTPDVSCVAAPVRDSSGAVVAAISLSVPTARFAQRAEDEWADEVRAAAEEFSARLGFAAPRR
ncbi:IclR family transcriptional regulator [Salinibacterium hongtaonis]|uniref:Glycerol operon regulatory protein n=1 Tax=Homoserinimonas hongtaonis TaxID=2079791 RepID=A0A2U1T1P6_9MICO|nr:IclR family transcriptional regulator [Salinibacterium hongtaonis]PWB97788.1 IclR family transcriptional regulator [Salinibacterium hongtaonis]